MNTDKIKIKIKINGTEYTGYKGETIYQVANRNGITIPVLCHDERLKPYSSCFVCVVEIEGNKNLQPSCSTIINDGMVINTENEKVRKARKTALDLLVSNHYADCLGPCKQTCPAGVDVQGYISLIEKGLYREAIELIKEVNPLPAICGRVCVRPCELACRRNLVGEGSGAGVDYLKRFVADKDLFSESRYQPIPDENTGKRVAVIGAGPGGLSAAYFLKLKGHNCDIFESNPNPGGWLRYGIPEYRLPNDILDKEITLIKELGINIFCNKKLGGNLSYKELKQNYDAVILTIGSQKGTKIGCDGDDAHNVFSGIDFLRNMEITGQKPDFSGKIAVTVGGGNTAMDCCRTSVRLGAKKVYVVYRRTETEMPANPIEIHESKLEGVEYLFLTNPVKVNKNNDGAIKSLSLIKMALGEPDSSGRRRPVEVPGSEFELECDVVLAAIGQKTDVNFLDDVNNNVEVGELRINKWGDIDADKKTLQTGIPSVFAAGDGVTGAATIIEAIAQAKIASISCHQFLMGEEIKPVKKEFLSRKDNFEIQQSCDYEGKYEKKHRHEMPILEKEARFNFNEVELGYENELVASEEASRCLECGCVEYFNCDLKKHSDEYGAEQNRYKGEFKKYEVDYSHPFIEIDNNKCILCSKCVRVCKEIVGANALGLVNRGFESYVAPAMGMSLSETNCESCGMCIDICPTGALNENVPFKPGPVIYEKHKTICNICSLGCEINLKMKNSFVSGVEGATGLINREAGICKYAKFGYNYINRGDRIIKPLIKKNGKFEELSYDEAISIIKDKIKNVDPDENAFFAGARLTNEELYLIQKFARSYTNTNNLSSYSLLGRKKYNLPVERTLSPDQLEKVTRVYLLGADIVETHPVAGYFINKLQHNSNIEIIEFTQKEKTLTSEKVNNTINIKSYYYFIKAVNYYLIKSETQNGLYLVNYCDGFDNYKSAILKENYEDLIKNAGCSKNIIEKFADDFDEETNAVIFTSENELSDEAINELYNCALITGKLGKISNGLVVLREKNNSQGLLDMGITPESFVGNISILDDSVQTKFASIWNKKSVPSKVNDIIPLLVGGSITNLFIFGEDPVGCSKNTADSKKWIQSEFLVVFDNFMTDTAKEANLIVPASFHFESGGSFSNSNRIIQQFRNSKVKKTKYNTMEVIHKIISDKGEKEEFDSSDLFVEMCEMLPSQNYEKLNLVYTKEEKSNKYFYHSCDYITKIIKENFEKRV